MNKSFSVEKPRLSGTQVVQLVCHEQDFSTLSWINDNKGLLKDLLEEYGALLFRNFPVSTVADFHSVMDSCFGDTLEYKFRTSPRIEVGDKIYTSTTHPADQVIHLHTENSYSFTWNQIIAFFCLNPPATGGETILADERRVIRLIDRSILENFEVKGVLYVRNTIPGIGLGWREVYQTNNRHTVEQFLRNNKMRFRWITEEHLRTEWVLPAFRTHPDTGEKVWFNHMFFGHKSLYDLDVVEFLGEENLPFVTYYGDGSTIPDDVIMQFKEAYNKCQINIQWQKYDMLILDNMMFAHGRNPFKGERKILVAMAKEFSDSNDR